MRWWSGAIDNRGGMRIDERIPLACARPATRVDATHQYQPFEQRGNFRIAAKEQSDIGERTNTQQGNLSCMLANRLAQELNRGPTREGCLMLPAIKRSGLGNIWLFLSNQQR